MTTQQASGVYVSRVSDEPWLCFFLEARADYNVDRLELLQKLSRVVIERPADWDYAAQRDKNFWDTAFGRSPSHCFSCRSGDRRLYWHHVIAIKHGGRTIPENLVPLCYRCHRVIHPWLPERADRDERYTHGRGWSRVGDITTVKARDNAR